MIRIVAVLGALAGLTGCSPEAPTPAPTEPVATPSPKTTAPAAAPTTAITPTKATTLPAPLVGIWTADPAGRCTPGTELRIDVRANQIRFYESVARVTGVTQVDPHSWGIDATVTGEGETRQRSFDLNLTEDGTMTRVEAPIPDITYTRCESET